MNKRVSCAALGAMFSAICLTAEAQQSKKVPRIGYVDAGSPGSTGHRAKAFTQGLHDLGVCGA